PSTPSSPPPSHRDRGIVAALAPVYPSTRLLGSVSGGGGGPPPGTASSSRVPSCHALPLPAPSRCPPLLPGPAFPGGRPPPPPPAAESESARKQAGERATE